MRVLRDSWRDVTFLLDLDKTELRGDGTDGENSFRTSIGLLLKGNDQKDYYFHLTIFNFCDYICISS